MAVYLKKRTGGGSGIRTHGGVSAHNGFQDRRLKPLSHPSREAYARAWPVLWHPWVFYRAIYRVATGRLALRVSGAATGALLPVLWGQV